jgi:hypothetical protein
MVFFKGGDTLCSKTGRYVYARIQNILQVIAETIFMLLILSH